MLQMILIPFARAKRFLLLSHTYLSIIIIYFNGLSTYINFPELNLGDFKSSHSSWGASSCNSSGNILFKHMTESNYVLQNYKSPTHLNTR